MNDAEKRRRRLKKIDRNTLIKYIIICFIFFLAITGIISISILLYCYALEIQINFRDAVHGAKLIIYISAAFSLIVLLVYIIIQHFTVNVPVRRIRKYLANLSEGKFDAEMKKLVSVFKEGQYNSIIDDIIKTADELKNTQTLRTDFVNNVSHEIKTPLAVIQNYSKLLQEENLPDDLRLNYAKNITSATEELNLVVTNALKLNKLEHQSIYPNHEKFNLSEQIALCILAYDEMIEEKNISLEINMLDGIIIDTDKELLQHVWRNLISNAIKFTENNGTISVSTEKFDDVVTVTVADTGCGISDEDMPHIFEKYFQANPDLQMKGNGLGLSLVKRIVDVLGMKISCMSELGVGTSFVVTIDV